MSTLFKLQYKLFSQIYDLYKQSIKNPDYATDNKIKHIKFDEYNIYALSQWKVTKVLFEVSVIEFMTELEKLKKDKKLPYNFKELYYIKNDEKKLPCKVKNCTYVDYLIYKRFTLPMWNPESINLNDAIFQKYNIYAGNNYLNTGYNFSNAVTTIVNYFENTNNDILILKAKTGTGKSVIVPPLLVEAGLTDNRKVVSTQPRRLNAEGIGGYVSTLMWTPLGEENGLKGAVGYKHKAKECKGDKLMYMTEGILIKQTSDKLSYLSDKYSFCVLDEVHERSINTDVLLALIKNILKNQNKKKKIKFIITSATFDALKFAKFYKLYDGNIDYSQNEKEQLEKQQPNTLVVSGVAKNVKSTFLNEPSKDYIQDSCNKALEIHETYVKELSSKERDIIIFVDALSTIRKMTQYLTETIIKKQRSNSQYNPVAVLSLTRHTSETQKDKIIKNIYGRTNDSCKPDSSSLNLLSCRRQRSKGGRYPPVQSIGSNKREKTQAENDAEKAAEKIMNSKCKIKTKKDKDIEVESIGTKLPPTRRIILATNTAETGVTFSNLRHVIDTGWMNVSIYDPTTGGGSLISSHISIDNALQRKGRVGRTETGFYWPMFTKKMYDSLKEHKIPSIYLEDISSNLLDIIQYINVFNSTPTSDIGVNNIYEFDFLDCPSINNVQRGLSELYLLGAIDSHLNITPIGMYMKPFMFSPKLSKALIVSPYYGCSFEVAVILSAIGNMHSVYEYAKDNFGNYGNVTYSNYQSDHINILVTFIKYSEFKQSVKGNIKKTEAWCKVNGLNYYVLNKIDDTVWETLKQLHDNNIPIISFNTNIFNEEKINNILKSLFAGLFLNTGEVEDYVKYFKIQNPLNNKEIPAIAYQSLFYTGNPQRKTIYPKNIFYTTLLLKNQNGIYVHYIQTISSYNPDWIGNITPNVNKIMGALNN